MTSSIRPPGGTGPQGPSSPKLDETQAAEVSETGSAPASDRNVQEPSTPTEEARGHAVHDAEAWVQQALESDLAKALTPAAQQELAAFLSDALAEDPHLQALLSQLKS